MIEKNTLELRPTIESDLETLFQIQLDKEAQFMAAFTPQNPSDKEAYLAKWRNLLNDITVNVHSIIVNENIIGSIAKFEMEGNAEITYWIDKLYWGKGVSTLALNRFLTIEKVRPLFGRVAFDNIGSQKVLLKCGFVKIGTDKYFANARGKEIEEFVYKFDR